MAAPYTVTITVTNDRGEEMTLLRQSLENYMALVEYQKALAGGIFAMADVVVKMKDQESKSK